MRKSRKEMLSGTGIFHKFWRGHNREKVLQTNAQKRRYLTELCTKLTEKFTPHLQLHSYCIMTNHPHEVGRVGWNPKIKNRIKKGIEALGDWMRNAHSAYGTWYNRTMKREGKVATARPKTTQISSEAGVLNTMLYADANPVRAGLVTHPSKYPWSSYRYYAYGEQNEFTEALEPPEAYLALGKTPELRQRAYRSLMDHYLRRNGLLDDGPDPDSIALDNYDSIFQEIEALFALSSNKARERPASPMPKAPA